MSKLRNLVYIHYNLRLRVRNLMSRDRDADYYNPIDLTHIFDDENILDPWIREVDEPALDGQPDDWLQQGFEEYGTEEGRHNIVERGDSGRTRGRSSSIERGESIETVRQRDRGKKKTIVRERDSSSGTGSSSSSSDERGSGGGGTRVYSGGGSGSGHGSGGARDFINQSDTGGMTWAQGNEGYYGTQDTDHGYRPIDERRRHLDRLMEFPSQDDDDDRPDPNPYYGRHSAAVGPIQLDVRMRGINLGQGPPPRRLSRSTSTGGDSHNRGPLHPDRRGPHVRMRERSTSTSSGGYYDRQQDYHQGSGSGSIGSGYGYNDRGGSSSLSSGPTGHGYGPYGGETSVDTAPPQVPYPQPMWPGAYDSNVSSQSQDSGSSFGFSLFYYPNPPQYYPPPPQYNPPPPQYYPPPHGSNRHDDFEPHRHSTWE